MFHEFELVLWSCHATSSTFKQSVDGVLSERAADDFNASEEIFVRVQTHLLHTAFYIKQSQVAADVNSKVGSVSAYEALLSATFPDFAS